MMWRYILTVILGFGGGVVIAGGVFAFIAVIGVVPRLAQKTKTQKYIQLFEDCITLGGIFGVSTMVFDYHIRIGAIAVVIYSLCIGIFVGCIAVSLAEVLDVIPILNRRLNVKVGIAFFIVSVAIGKMVGSLIYYLIPGFYKSMG